MKLFLSFDLTVRVVADLAGHAEVHQRCSPPACLEFKRQLRLEAAVRIAVERSIAGAPVVRVGVYFRHYEAVREGRGELVRDFILAPDAEVEVRDLHVEGLAKGVLVGEDGHVRQAHPLSKFTEIFGATS